MKKWEDVTESFSEEQRHYKNTYLEICEVYDENVEVSLFSSEYEPYEIYISYGIMSGIIYAEKEKADLIREEVKRELQLEYQNYKEPTGIFINEFSKKHKVCYPEDIFFDSSAIFDIFE